MMTDFSKIEQTLARLRAVHVKNPRDDAFADHLNRLLKRSPDGDLLPEAVRFTNTGETRGIMVIDGPGGGKSTMLKRGLSRHPAFRTFSDDMRPYIAATVPSPATLKSMAGHLLELSGLPSTSSHREVWSKWQLLKQRFLLLETAALWIDEAHDLFCADKNLILRAIKSLMQGDSAVIVILSGTSNLPRLSDRTHRFKGGFRPSSCRRWTPVLIAKIFFPSSRRIAESRVWMLLSRPILLIAWFTLRGGASDGASNTILRPLNSPCWKVPISWKCTISQRLGRLPKAIRSPTMFFWPMTGG